MKTYKTLALCLAMLSFIACSRSSLTSSGTPKPSPTNSPTPATNPQSDAQKQAEEFWSKYVAACGDSYFMKSQDEGKFVELRDMRVVVKFQTITEADRLNGIEAKGSTSLKSSSYRHFYDSQWHEWNTGTPSGMTYDARFQKSNGKWVFEGSSYFNSFARTMNCKEVPTEEVD